MEFNIDYNIIMYIIIGIIIVYILFSILGTAKTVEGMEDKKSDTKPLAEILAEGDHKQIKKVIEKNDDMILIDKYRSDYEEVLIDLEETINQNLLMGLLSLSARIKAKDAGFGMNSIKPEDLEFANNLYKLRDNLSSTMDYIDGKKS